MDEEQTQARLALLNVRLEEFRPELDEKIRQAFQGWFRGKSKVQLYSSRCEFGCMQEKLRLRFELTVDYGAFLASGVFWQKVSGAVFSSSDGDILRSVHQNVPQILKALVRSLPKHCTLMADNRCSSTVFSRVTPKNREWYRAVSYLGGAYLSLAKCVLPALEEKVLGLVREDLARKQSELPSPAPWLAPGRAEACRLEAGIQDLASLSLRCEVQVRWWNVSQETATVTGRSIWTEATTWSEEDLASLLQAEWETLALAAGRKICDALTAYQVIPPEEDPGEARFPPELWSFLREGNARMGHCLVQSEGSVWSGDPFALTQSAAPMAPFFLAFPGPDAFQVMGLPLAYRRCTDPLAPGMDALLSPADPLSGAIRPVTLAGTLRVLKGIADLYEREDFGEVPKPTITFTVRDGRLRKIEWMKSGQKIRGQEQASLENQPGVFAEELVMRVREESRKRKQRDDEAARLLAEHTREAQPVLNSLNPVVLAILQNISRYGRTGCGVTELEHAIPVAKDSLQGYLVQACRVKIPVDGVLQPLLRHTSFSPDRYDCQDLFPGLWKVLLDTAPAPYSLEDFRNLSPSERDQALWEQAARVDTREARWELLEILEKGIPKTAAADFVKSEPGQTFLRGLEGDDREYARLFLEDLPGCRRLVRSLLGSSSQADSEPTPPTESG